jgi:hypothetical protein
VWPQPQSRSEAQWRNLLFISPKKASSLYL